MPVIVDLDHLNEEQDPDPHQSERPDPDPSHCRQVLYVPYSSVGETYGESYTSNDYKESSAKVPAFI
jgi:hypothetical protein